MSVKPAFPVAKAASVGNRPHSGPKKTLAKIQIDVTDLVPAQAQGLAKVAGEEGRMALKELICPT
jgi:hypothetical protein